MIELRPEFKSKMLPPLGTSDHVYKRLEAARENGHAVTEATNIAAQLITAGDHYTQSAIPHLGVAPFMKDEGITSRYNSVAPYYDRWAGKDFAFVDPENGALPDGERYNDPGTRRSTLTGVEYGFDKTGRPQNPYLTTSGVKGRFGAQWSVNTTIDILAVDIKTDKNGQDVLTEMSIHNEHGGTGILGGYFESKPGPDGRHMRTPEAIFETKVREYFEEAISGSIPLLPEYEAKLDTYSGPPPERPAKAKWDQVMQYDSDFIKRLEETMKRTEQIVAEGPILLSPGTTDNSWGESSVSWFLMRDKDWAYIVGENPEYPYERKGGDDAEYVIFQEFSAENLAATRASHRAFKAYIMADLILAKQAEGYDFSKSRILDQAQDMISYLDGQSLTLNQKTFEDFIHPKQN